MFISGNPTAFSLELTGKGSQGVAKIRESGESGSDHLHQQRQWRSARCLSSGGLRVPINRQDALPPNLFDLLRFLDQRPWLHSAQNPSRRNWRATRTADNAQVPGIVDLD